MTPKIPQPSLTERRARLRELLKRDDATFWQYHEVLTGATEDERKSLARTLSIKKLIDRYSREGTTEQRLVCVYTAAALGGTFKHVGVELLNLIGRGLPGEANWKFSTAESEQYLSQRTEAMMLGLSERDNTWITGFVNERGYGRFGYDLPTLWVQIHQLLHERGLTNTTRSYLWGFVTAVPDMYIGSSENREEVISFFKNNSQTLEHEMWACFTDEGLLRKEWSGRENADTLALFHMLQENFDGFRDRLLTECLKAMLRDFSAKNTSIFHHIYRGMNPTPDENLDNITLLTSVLTTVPSTSVGLAQEMLMSCVEKLTEPQIHDLLNASHTVMLRTEKKILRAQIALLGAIARTHPEYTQDVDGLMRETAESLPPDLQPAAQTLMSPAEAAADKTSAPSYAEQVMGSVMIPENLPQLLEQHVSTPQVHIYTSDAEFMDGLIPCLQGTGDGSQLPQLIDYLAHNPRITLDAAQQDFLAERCVNSGIRSGTHALGNYLMYRVIAPHRKLFKKLPQGFTGYRHEFHTNPQTGETIQPYQVEHTGSLGRQKPRIEKTTTNYRGPAGLCQEQIDCLEHPENLVFVPIPHAEESTWTRRVEPLTYRPRPHNMYDQAYAEAPNDSLMMWLIEDHELPTAQMPFAQAALNTAGIPEEFMHRAVQAIDDFHRTLMQWYAWLLQNNPNTLAAQSMPFVTTTGFQKHVKGLETILDTITHTHQVLQEPAYSVLGWLTGAAAAEHRALTAESIAALAGRGMLDASLLANELAYLLRGGWVKPVRAASCLQDAASISPLAGWRIVQVLENMLPMVGEINRGSALVQLLLQLAGEYGVSIKIPEVLQPKMKGSTVLVKNLRALEKLEPHPTELAEKARQHAQNLLDKRLGRDITVKKEERNAN